MKPNPPTEAFPFPTLSFDVAALKAFTRRCIEAGVSYGWGSKVPRHGAKPGTDFHSLDCSGFVDEAVFLASGYDLPAGSWYEEEAVKAAGFKRSDVSAATRKDGVVRIAFYPGTDADPTRHVMLVLDGLTYESRGHHGVGNRTWGSQAFMARCSVYVLTAPK